MTKYGKCIHLAARLVNKYNPQNQSLEHFVEESTEDFESLSNAEERFVLEVLSGCVQYREILDIVVRAFYARHGKQSLLSEHCVYAVTCYITTFKLEELGLQTFGKILKCQDITKIGKFLRFFFDPVHLSTWIKDEWSQIYDSDYVKENWIGPLLKWQAEVLNLLDGLESKSLNGSTPVKASKVTEVREFNLTKPRPKTIPEPQRIPAQKPHHPVPESTYKPPKENDVLLEKKLNNQKKAEELLIDANMVQFKCANTEKSEKTKRVMAEIMKQDHAVSFKARQVQLKKVDSVPVRLNATAILREGALYQRQVEEELRRIEKLVDGARDPSEFLEWQRQMREQDLERQLAAIECRRLEGKLSHEEAVLARQNLIQENKKKAVMKKEETEKLMRQYAEKRLQEEKEMRDLVEQVSEGHKNTKQARLKLQKYKQQIVQEVTEESRELLRRALEEAEEELKRKFELIREIRAMESVPVIRHKFVDLTQTAGHGLNCEMSIVELHERLALLKDAQRKAEEEKRDQILEEKQSKQQHLLETLEQISLHRAALGKAALLRLDEKRAKPESVKAAVANNNRVTELQRKLQEKMAERKAQTEAFKRTPQRHTSRSSKDNFVEKHWRELEESRERQAQLLQHGVVSRETANRIATYQATRNRTTPLCLLQS